MFRKILIANRGEIAVRIVRACRELGIGSVAVYSAADRNALHVQRADEAYFIGPAPAAESYLNVSAIIEAARRSGAAAVHPGFGFLSENADFATACLAAGLVFIGPPPAAMRLMGDKIAAKQAARAAGVPTVPGYLGEDGSDRDRLITEAGRIGFPVLVKAAAGGGGRGLRVVDSAADLNEAIEGAQREARAAFGDDRVFLERYLRRPRHIEIQILADGEGRIVHLGERECSIQRRHQKVLEESPSPALTRERRALMGQAAIAVARAAGYVNAGTVEFIVDESDDFYFLEMNTRLQVEHPVTEMVTGLDLVHLQIAIAAGEPLGLAQSAIEQSGHAIEVRVYAEDAAAGFLPATGRLTAFDPPVGPGIRNDVGVAEGGEVSVHYDPMLAKLIVQAPDRTRAIARLRDALAHYEVAGVTTNLPFLRWLAAHPAFAAGATTTDFIDRYFQPAELRSGPPDEILFGAAAADLLRSEWAGSAADTEPKPVDPWREAGPWRLLRRNLRFQYLAGGRTQTVTANHLTGRRWELAVEDRRVEAEIEAGSGGAVLVQTAGRLDVFHVERRGDDLQLTWRDEMYRLSSPRPAGPEALAHGGAGAAGEHRLTSPMPGTIVKVLVQEGDRVEALQSLIVLEAMKMEHVIQAPYAGIVHKIHYQPGDLVPGGAPLIELTAD